MLNVSSACLLVGYANLFKKVSSSAQVILAFGLPLIRFGIKSLSKMAAMKSNPDFAHGAGFFSEAGGEH